MVVRDYLGVPHIDYTQAGGVHRYPGAVHAPSPIFVFCFYQVLSTSWNEISRHMQTSVV
jgi:hypothetical protein